MLKEVNELIKQIDIVRETHGFDWVGECKILEGFSVNLEPKESGFLMAILPKEFINKEVKVFVRVIEK